MRSRTLPDLPGRCRRCWVKVEACICSGLERVENVTEIVFVRHHWEAHKSTNTARIAALALARSRFVEFGYDTKLADAELSHLEGAHLLYPGQAGSALPAPNACRRLVVLDGTWAQTRRMLRRLPALAELPRLSLPPPGVARVHLRHGHLAESRSTIEAVADALALLGGRAAGDALLHAADRHARAVLSARWGRRPALV